MTSLFHSPRAYPWLSVEFEIIHPDSGHEERSSAPKKMPEKSYVEVIGVNCSDPNKDVLGFFEAYSDRERIGELIEREVDINE